MKWLFLFLPILSFSQSSIDQAAEYLIQTNNTEQINEQLIIVLNEFENNPLKINSAPKEVLDNFPFFSQKHISIILQYRRKNHNILSLKELSLLPYFNSELIKIIQPFISFSSKLFIPKPIYSFLYRIKIPLQKPLGYLQENDSLKIIGPWTNHYFKFNGKWKSNECSFIYQKNFGEQFIQKGTLFK